MADAKITALTAVTALTTGDLFAVIDDVAGTPTTKKITADNAFASISDLAPIPKVLYSDVGGTATGANTTETDLSTYTLPAGTLSANGDMLEIDFFAFAANTGNNKTVRIYVGGTVIIATGTLGWQNSFFHFKAYVWRTSAGNQRVEVSAVKTDATATLTGDVTNLAMHGNDTTLTKDETSTIIIKMTGQNATAAASDIVARPSRIVFYPAP